MDHILHLEKINSIDGILGGYFKKIQAILDYKSNKLYLKLWSNRS